MPLKDEIVEQENVMKILRRVRKSGWKVTLHRLETEEPVLAGFAMVAMYQLAKQLDPLGLPYRVRLVIEHEVMISQLVCIEAMREAMRNLWDEFLPSLEATGEGKS